MQIKTIVPGVIHFDFATIMDMASALGRAQEYAENPTLRKTIFSWSRLKHLYRGNYKKSALGFNIPGWAFEPFFDGRFKLTKHEEVLIQALRGIPTDVTGIFYVIATADGSATKPRNEALMHEVAHGLWYTNEAYRVECQRVLLSLGVELRDLLLGKLAGWGIYHPSVLEDELHAYLGTDTTSVFCGRFSVKEIQIRDCHLALRDILDRYANLS